MTNIEHFLWRTLHISTVSTAGRVVHFFFIHIKKKSVSRSAVVLNDQCFGAISAAKLIEWHGLFCRWSSNMVNWWVAHRRLIYRIDFLQVYRNLWFGFPVNKEKIIHASVDGVNTATVIHCSITYKTQVWAQSPTWSTHLIGFCLINY